MKFTIEIRDYESGFEDDRLTTSRVEGVVQRMLDKDGSSGVVIVTKEDDADA